MRQYADAAWHGATRRVGNEFFMNGGGKSMVDTSQIDWKAIDSRPEFQELHRRKMGFLWGLMIFSMVYYFLLPIGAAYFQDLYRIKVWGPVNVGILFALSEFVVAWALAFIYARRASTVFDPMAAAIVRDAEKSMGGKK
jgi:uncharacterized membrane protein (DUF485 family)